MFFYNPVEFFINVSPFNYVVLASVFLGISLLVKLLVFGKGHDFL